jgi:hypothetical protein
MIFQADAGKQQGRVLHPEDAPLLVAPDRHLPGGEDS